MQEYIKLQREVYEDKFRSIDKFVAYRYKIKYKTCYETFKTIMKYCFIIVYKILRYINKNT